MSVSIQIPLDRLFNKEGDMQYPLQVSQVWQPEHSYDVLGTLYVKRIVCSTVYTIEVEATTYEVQPIFKTDEDGVQALASLFFSGFRSTAQRLMIALDIDGELE